MLREQHVSQTSELQLQCSGMHYDLRRRWAGVLRRCSVVSIGVVLQLRSLCRRLWRGRAGMLSTREPVFRRLDLQSNDGLLRVASWRVLVAFQPIEEISAVALGGPAKPYQ
jgi:hypothetical protein